MKLSELVAVKINSKKRLGRGLGSGKGKTGGRGMKGQKARGKIPARFSGGVALYRKLPLKRGFGNTKISLKSVAINLADLNVFAEKSVVDVESLLKMGIISERNAKSPIKILNGKVEKALTVKLPVSTSARKSIEERGGAVEND